MKKATLAHLAAAEQHAGRWGSCNHGKDPQGCRILRLCWAFSRTWWLPEGSACRQVTAASRSRPATFWAALPSRNSSHVHRCPALSAQIARVPSLQAAAWRVLSRLSDQRRPVVVPQMVRVSSPQNMTEALERSLCVSACAAQRPHPCGDEAPGLACCATEPPWRQITYPAQFTC